MKIDLKFECSCGGKIALSSDNFAVAQRLLQLWLEQHKGCQGEEERCS